MLMSTMIMGWIGVLLFLMIAFLFQKMAKHNEFAFLHLVIAFMYAMWLPLPLALNQLLNSDFLQVGMIFGLAYVSMTVVTMTLQSGHISYIVKQNNNQAITENQSDYMMATLSNPFESLANVFRCIWALFIGIALMDSKEYVMASFMFFYSLLFFYYFFMMLDRSLVKRVKVFSKVKPNFISTNLETFIFFVILMGYITFKS